MVQRMVLKQSTRLVLIGLVGCGNAQISIQYQLMVQRMVLTLLLMTNKWRMFLRLALDELKRDFYYIGYYNITSDRFVPAKDIDGGRLVLRYDYGKYYASKTFYDAPNNRRILWGWLNESSSVISSIKRGWAGIQAFPRTIWLDKSGKQLVQWPVPEIEKLRTKPIKWTEVIEIVDYLMANEFLHLQNSLFYVLSTTLFEAGFLLHIDHSVVESFGGEGKVCMSTRVYPTLAINNESQVLAFNNGTSNVTQDHNVEFLEHEESSDQLKP